MTTRWAIAALVYMMTNAVLFGIGATIVLSVPTLATQAMVLMPAVVVGSFVLGAPLAWYIAPMLRSRYQRQLELRRRYDERFAPER